MANRFKVEGVLGGGGVKGFCHIGFLKACRTENVSFSSLTCVSVGTLVGVLHVNGYSPEEIHKIFAERLRTRLSQAARNYSPDVSALQLASSLVGYRPAIVDAAFMAVGAPGSEDIRFDNVDEARIAVAALTAFYPDLLGPMREMVAELGLKPGNGLKIVAFDAIERKPVVFEGTDYDLALALTASCALPGAFRPVANPLGKGLLIDGAMYHRNPVEFCEGKALVSKLVRATALPNEMLNPIEFMGHMREMMGLCPFHRHEVDTSAGHIVIEQKSPHVAGLSFGISRATQDSMVDDAESHTLEVLRSARENGSL